MMRLAMENNLSETAFIVREAAGYHLRWFTPGGEIDFCGHATLGTAYVLHRFYRPDASRSRESGGYGIGLSMVRAIAEKHGGRAWAERTAEGRIRLLCDLPLRHGSPAKPE